jgi:hypothetical protein
MNNFDALTGEQGWGTYCYVTCPRICTASEIPDWKWYGAATFKEAAMRSLGLPLGELT